VFSNNEKEKMDDRESPFLGIISGQRKRDHAEVAGRTERIAGGLHRLGVKSGNSVCILMRNDVAFIEAAYAAMRLGAYGVPINWHFKPDEINHVRRLSHRRAVIRTLLFEPGFEVGCKIGRREMIGIDLVVL